MGSRIDSSDTSWRMLVGSGVDAPSGIFHISVGGRVPRPIVL